ncbi:MAG: MFS transporter [Mycobacteriales bacterium]
MRRFDAHEWSVLLPLCLVGFFTNYDTGLLALGAPVIADGLDVSVATFGIGVALIRLGALGSVVMLRLADRWGRRPLLLLSVLAFTALTGLTALAAGLVVFVVLQVLARVFLTTEETLAGVVLTEELRPEHRGAGIGMLGIISTTGFGLVALLLLAVNATPLGWRLFYVVALLPLAVVIYLRRNLAETRAYALAAETGRVRQPWWPELAPVDARHLRRLLVVLAAVGMLTTAAFFFAAELAQNDYGWKGLFTVVVFAAAPTTLLGYVAGGKLSDRFGRRPVLAVSVLTMSAGSLLVFSGQQGLYAPGFFLLAGSDAAIQAVRTAFAGELFPTEVRGTLGAVALAVLVVAGSVGLLLAGVLASVVDPTTTVLALAALAAASTLALRGLPETAGADVLSAARDPAGP